jgi:hypothetical protein
LNGDTGRKVRELGKLINANLMFAPNAEEFSYFERSMRTTLTLDKDVAAVIERLRKTRDDSMKSPVNQALREGLKHIAAPRRKQVNYRTASVDLGCCLLGSVDNVAEVLAVAERESFK